MTEFSDDETLIHDEMMRSGGLSKTLPDQSSIENAISDAVHQANIETGGRDLLVLGISSFFAFFLILFAPFIASSARKNMQHSSGNVER